LLWEMEK